MGGNDKALVPLHGKPMIEWVIERLWPQVDALFINSNSLAPQLMAHGYPIIADQITGYAGPLAGLHACMMNAATPLLACVPCDAPTLPLDLVERLRTGMMDAGADIAVAHTASSLQPTFFVCRNTLGKSIEDYLAKGGYALRRWMTQQHCVDVNFTDESAFININSPQDLADAESKLPLPT